MKKQGMLLLLSLLSSVSIFTVDHDISVSSDAMHMQKRYDRLKKYNKWLKTKTIPSDKAYSVIIPDLITIPIDPIFTKKDSLLIFIFYNIYILRTKLKKCEYLQRKAFQFFKI